VASKNDHFRVRGIGHELSKAATAKLEQYRKTPRKRPDWGTMMKEIEEGKTLRRVVTNDRSKPILPKSKAKGKVLHGQISVTGPITGSGDQSDDETTVVNFTSKCKQKAAQLAGCSDITDSHTFRAL